MGTISRRDSFVPAAFILPIKLFINGTQVDFLNRHFTAETMDE